VADLDPRAAAVGEVAAAESFCYLTTTGRVSGRPHTIEIWFAVDGSTLYLLSGGAERSDWVRNLIRTPAVEVRIADRTFPGTARVVTDPAEDERARRLVHDKYQPGYRGDLTEWRQSSLPVAVDLTRSTSELNPQVLPE
jgi:deazaflavin-dependent oxidoreductase (nitroreductase family)